MIEALPVILLDGRRVFVFAEPSVPLIEAFGELQIIYPERPWGMPYDTDTFT